jgi:glycyl-tRNA synthetase
MDASDVLSLCKRRGYLYPSFEIYGGVAGFYDYGPLGVAMRNNIVEIWRRLYTLGEGFVEIDSETVGPEIVFKASGHVDEFADKMVRCRGCDEAHRADHLVKELHPNPGVLEEKELDTIIRNNGVTCPACGGELSSVEEFNLMFKTMIGPGSGRVGYLRPETAQGIFVNFPSLYRYNREKLPLGVIQVGRGYRNEISPRQGVIRMREFNMMECELFVDPEDKGWPRFRDVKGEMLHLVANDGQEVDISVGDAVEQGMICNQVLGYFMWFTQEFLKAIGVDGNRLRFRQHEKDEMAHYAADCWDAEALLSFGWTEIVGIADRGCWDLSRHIRFSGVDMSAFRRFETAHEVEREVIKPKYGQLGPKYKALGVKIGKAMEATDPSNIEAGGFTVEVEGQLYPIDASLYDVVKVKEKVSGVKFVPHVIEPSHGLDRITYTCLEHAYDKKGDMEMLRLSASIAPLKFGVFPLMARDDLDKVAMEIDQEIRYSGIETYYDDSGSIGRRYARMDEVGTPYCITVDYQTLEDGTVTLRERDSQAQVRVKAKEVVLVARAALCGASIDQFVLAEDK